MRHLCTLFAALCLAAVACGNDDEGGAVPTTSGSLATTTTTAVPAAETILAGGERCTSPEGFSIAYPSDWGAVSDCGQFGPLPVDEPEPGTDERTGVVSAFVDRVPFSDVAEPGPEERSRAVTAVDGLQAVRVELVTYLPVPYPARESRAFAVPLDPAQITEITVRAIDGTVLAEPEPSEARRPAR